jgi:acetylornithine deacetylase/succinyl-diaminopimelate desuccinylase-like protein
VSGDPGHRGDVQRAAALLVAALRRAGADPVPIGDHAPAPVVVGRTAARPGAPVVLVYGHYDVQPAGPGWTSAPFRPVLRAGRLVARGTADDKGQLAACLAALQAWRRSAGGPPSQVVVVAEGAEEVGSPGLAPALAEVARRVRPDVILVCDTERAPDGVPAVTVSQRGHAVLDLVVDVGGPAVHAGRLGGAVVDPSHVLARILLDLRADLASGRWPDLPRQWGLPVLERREADVARAAGGRAMTGTGLDRRSTAGPALTVLRLEAGSGAGVVPAVASARLDVRLPAGADVRATVARLGAVARAGRPAGVRVAVTARADGAGFAARPQPAALAAVDAACRAAYGRPVRLVRSGGSLPAAGLLAERFGHPPIMLGLGSPAGGAHGPDEHLDLAGWSRAVDLLVVLFAAPLAPVEH